MKKILVGIMAFAFVLSGCGGSDSDDGFVVPPETKEKEEKKITKLIQFQESYSDDTPVAVMETTMGNITIVFFEEQAPKASENFLTHSKNGYYDGLTFHRVMSDFMIQGGDPTGTGTSGESIWGEAFEDEISDELFNFRGALSMANSGANTNGSQFFIVQSTKLSKPSQSTSELVQEKYKEVGGTPWLDGVHTVFGQVIDGMDVVDTIAGVPVNASSSKPEEDVLIKGIKVMTYKEYKAK